MKKQFSENITVQLAFLSLVVFLSRLPFLWAGYGSEEDAWLIPITAKNIALSGTYEMSRAPGHPLQELLYSLMWNAGPFAYNLITAIASVVAVLFFAMALRNLGFKHYLFAAFAFAFTPIVFVSSTYDMDYMPAMAFVMGSFYFLTSATAPLSDGRGAGGEGLAGLLLGIAIGFRLTSAAMIIPFYIFSGHNWKFRRIFLFSITTITIATLTYIPVLKTYGLSFFTYSDQFPYPNIPKVVYKATIGVFGMIGILALIFFKTEKLAKKLFSKKNQPDRQAAMPGNLFWASIAVIVIYFISYLKLPQKSAYMIPIVPFIIMTTGYYISDRAFKTFCVLLSMSSFLFSINLTDSLRGSKHSALAMQFTMAGQEIFIDPLTGPIFADYTKRQNKIEFTEEIYQKTLKENKKIVLICGWWFNELIVRNWDSEQNKNVQPVFYIDKTEMEKYISEGYEIYYLPEQNLYNDQFSRIDCTDTLSKPYF